MKARVVGCVLNEARTLRVVDESSGDIDITLAQVACAKGEPDWIVGVFADTQDDLKDALAAVEVTSLHGSTVAVIPMQGQTRDHQDVAAAADLLVAALSRGLGCVTRWVLLEGRFVREEAWRAGEFAQGTFLPGLLAIAAAQSSLRFIPQRFPHPSGEPAKTEQAPGGSHCVRDYVVVAEAIARSSGVCAEILLSEMRKRLADLVHEALTGTPAWRPLKSHELDLIGLALAAGSPTDRTILSLSTAARICAGEIRRHVGGKAAFGAFPSTVFRTRVSMSGHSAHTCGVTIAIPAFNAERWIESAITSALCQSYNDVEVVVLDDCSTDRTSAMVQAFADPRLRYIRQPSRVGRGRNVKRAFESGTGGLVTVLPADCVLPEDSIAIRVAAMEKLDHSGFVFGAVEFVDEDSRAVGTAHRPWLSAWSAAAGDAAEAFWPWNRAYTSSVLVSRDAYEVVGGLPVDSAPTYRDWDLFLRLACMFPVAYVPTAVAFERVHAGNYTSYLVHSDLKDLCEFLAVESFARWGQNSGRATAANRARAMRWAWGRRHLLAAVSLSRRGAPREDALKALGLGILGSSDRSLLVGLAVGAQFIPRRSLAAATALRRLALSFIRGTQQYSQGTHNLVCKNDVRHVV